MDKFIYIADVHYGAKPLARKDEYNESILRKLEWILKICDKNECILIIGGDLTDTPRIKFTELTLLIELFNKYPNVKKYCIHGNEGHDGFENASPLTLLKMAGVIEKNEAYEDFENTRIIFGNHGFDFSKTGDLCHKEKINILMTHTNIVESPVIFDHILMSELNTKAEIVTVAHYHPYQGVIKENGTIFIAPGALARRKKVTHDLDRIPKCVYITIGNSVNIKEIDIPCEKNIWAEKIGLDITDELLYAELSKEVDNMKAIIDQKLTFTTMQDYLDIYAKAVEAEVDIVKECKERLKLI